MAIYREKSLHHPKKWAAHGSQKVGGLRPANFLALVAAPISGPPTFLCDVNFFFLYIAIMTGENLQ